MKNKILSFFKINSDYKIAKRLFLIMLFTGILLFSILIINYHTNADGIIEGMYYYHNADWASTGCGRFLIRYMNYAFANNVMPLINILLYIVFIYLSVLLINKLFSIKNTLIIYLIGIIMLASPTVIDQMSYQYMVLAFGISCFFATLFVYTLFKLNPKYSILIGAICLIITLGLYQSYLGYAAALVLITASLYLLKGEQIIDILKKDGYAIVSALLGCIGYLGAFKLDQLLHHYVAGDRAASFSISALIESLPTKFVETYSIYFSYFNDDVLKRKYIYLLILLIIVILLGKKIIKLVNEKKYSSILLIIIMLLLVPAASNVMGIIIPSFNVYLLMEHQNAFVVVFLLLLIDIESANIAKCITYILVLFLAWTYIISANATYRCFDLSYNAINKQYEQVLYDVYHTDGYVKDQTPIVFIGYLDDETIRTELPLYCYSIDFPDNPAFWEDDNGIGDNRYYYLLNYFGVNSRIINLDEYYSLIEMEEIEKMTVWPSSDSIKIINGYCVVKLN